MQCYFAIKESLKGKAKDMIYQLEKQAQTPSWADLIPSWFTPVAEDWMALARRDPFVQFRYAFRVALVYRYFHVLYQYGDYEKVFEDFKKSFQNLVFLCVF